MNDRPTPDERRFRALASASLDHIAEVDACGNTVYVSPNHRKDQAGPFTLDHVESEDRGPLAQAFAAVFEGESRRAAFRFNGPGGRRWVEVTMTPVVTEEGETHALVVSRDVTEARLTEQHLRESREHFQLIAEHAYDMIAELDHQGRLLYANGRVWDVLGYGPDEQRANPIELLHPDERQNLVDVYRSVRDGRIETSHELIRVRRADGSWSWVDTTIRSVERPDGQRRQLVIARDVSARVEAEQRVKESEARYRDLVESAPLGIFVIQDGRIVYANSAAAPLCGAASPEALVGTRMFDLLDPDEAAEVASALARSADDAPRTDAVRISVRGLDGERRLLQGAGSPTTYNGAPAQLGIVHDVTELERSQHEQERLELQLQEARKLESLGVLAGGIAHDFNNLLAVILSSVRYAGDPDVEIASRREALADAEEAAETAARLVKQLLAYAGRRKPEVGEVDLSELTGSLADLLGTAMPSAVELRLDLDTQPVLVHADLVQLEQVLMNLVLNAAEALGDGPGSVRIRTLVRELSHDDLSGWLAAEGLAPGSYGCLEVEDTGVGMDAETCARIFDPFFTTKAEGHGLGLSAVLGLVRGHHGAIDVRSQPGRGTCFRIALPIPARALLDRNPHRGQPLVLVADTDPGRLLLAAETLRADAFEVLEASDSTQLLDLWTLHGEEIDVVVIDDDLAAIDQPLVRALRSDRPEVALLAVQGAHAPAPARHAEGATAFLAKPWAEHELRKRVVALLEKGE